MKKLISVVSVFVVFLCLVLSGCESVDNRFVGTWDAEDEGVTYTLYSDGSFSSIDIDGTSEEGTWKVQDERFILRISDDSGDITILSAMFSFSENDTKLTLESIEDQQEFEWIKQ
jgi:hypothetical protein